MDPFLMAVFLLLFAFGLLAVDLFLPSAGLFLAIAGLAAMGSVLFAFRSGYQTGMAFLFIVLAAIPGLFWLFVKVWPNTPIGRRIIGTKPDRQEYHWASLQTLQDPNALVGSLGRTLTELVPAGTVDIEGRHYDCLSDGRPIGKGVSVRVIRIDIGRLVVTEFSAPGTIDRPGTGPTASPSVPQDKDGNPPVDSGLPESDSLLDRPIDDWGLESLKDE